MNYELKDKDQNFKSTALKNLFIVSIMFITVQCSLVRFCPAEILNRVVAYVDDTAITLLEFNEFRMKMKETASSVTDEEVINSMINRQLLFKEARKMRLEAATKDDLLKDYIDIKIKTAIIIKEADIERFYSEHLEEFKGRSFSSVRDEIDKYLFELEVNRQLKKHLEDLRTWAEIKIQLENSKGSGAQSK